MTEHTEKQALDKWQLYEAVKRWLQELNLTSEDYEKYIRDLAERLGV